MPHVSDDDLRKFEENMNAAYKRIGGGKLATDFDTVRAAVRRHQAAAYRYVEIHCHMATSQPGYLQPAMVVALACRVELNDEGLVNLVLMRARELDAMEHLESLFPVPEESPSPLGRSEEGSTVMVPCNGRDGKRCSLIQIDNVTKDQLRRGI